jgi:hypothetical protein
MTSLYRDREHGASWQQKVLRRLVMVQYVGLQIYFLHLGLILLIRCQWGHSLVVIHLDQYLLTSDQASIINRPSMRHKSDRVG